MSRTRLTRRERLALAGAALSGAVSGILRSAITWLLDRLTDFTPEEITAAAARRIATQAADGREGPS
ncbi:hypothetical protein [Streptomyces sp. NPDC003247]|uniref:hypothetical protein n=1 Tax=Streptomyces sp. NPDC003247 TaxID=3364677 RepID=UPI0036A9331F